MDEFSQEVPVPSQQMPAWTILRAEDYPIVGAGGMSQRGKRVFYQLANGQVSFVEVPLSDFNTQTVSKMVNDAAIEHYGVLGLQGPNIPA